MQTAGSLNAETSSKMATNFVVLSESKGILSEHARREHAQMALLAYLQQQKPIERELTAVYMRGPEGLIRL